ncbi:hypothetical protein [Azospirillum sp. Marseille-Q6669]
MWLIENIGTIFIVASSVIGTAAVIASVTPTPKDDEWAAKARKVLDMLAFNVGNARNR